MIEVSPISSFRILQLLQRGDFGLKLRGNLLKLFGSLRLDLLQMYSGSQLLVGGTGFWAWLICC